MARIKLFELTMHFECINTEDPMLDTERNLVHVQHGPSVGAALYCRRINKAVRAQT